MNIAANEADLAVGSVSLRGISPTSSLTSVAIAKMWVVRNTQICPLVEKNQSTDVVLLGHRSNLMVRDRARVS